MARIVIVMAWKLFTVTSNKPALTDTNGHLVPRLSLIYQPTSRQVGFLAPDLPTPCSTLGLSAVYFSICGLTGAVPPGHPLRKFASTAHGIRVSLLCIHFAGPDNDAGAAEFSPSIPWPFTHTDMRRFFGLDTPKVTLRPTPFLRRAPVSYLCS